MERGDAVSRDLSFDDLPENERKHIEPYVPGTIGYPEDVIDQIVERYLAIPESKFSDAKDNLDMIIGPAAYKVCLYPREEFKPNAFLDGLLRKMYKEAEGLYLTCGGDLVSAVIQVLFNLQYNDFLIDTTSYPTHPNGPNYMTSQLRGEPDRLLNVTCIGDINEVAIDVKYCDLSYHGKAKTVGCAVHNSVLSIAGDFEYFGMMSGDSEFHVPAKYVGRVSTIITGCTVYADSDDVDIDEVDEKFFLKENTLRVPDGSGGWREVKP